MFIMENMVRNNKLNKTISQRIHAKRRIKQRLGITLTTEDLENIIYNIQIKRDCYFIDKQSNRVTRFFVNYKNKNFIAVYDKIRKSIITILTEEMVNSNE